MNKRIPEQFSTLVELLRWRTLHQSERPAYTFLTDEEQKEVHLTYGELDRRARAIAALLQSLGTKGERALLLHPPGLDYITALFGCFYAKVIAVPAYPPHPTRIDRTLPRLQAIAHDAGTTLALTTSHTLSSMEFLTPGQQGLVQAEELASLRWIATDNMEDGLEERWKEPTITSETLAYLQYTSGSTDAPKGVMVCHRNVLHNSAVLHQGWQIPPHGEMVSWLPMHHDLGLVGGVLNPFCNGYHSTLMSPSSFLKWPLRWLQAISRVKDRPTISCAPNFAYDLCTRKATSDGKKENLDLSNWCVAVNGAEPVRMETLERFTKTFEPCGFRWEAFWPGYGLAEATLCVSGGGNTEPPITHYVDKAALANDRVVDAGNDDEGTCTLVGCGQALLDQTIAIVDPISLTRCPRDQIGEIWVSGPSVAQGYWNRAEETKSTFQVHLADTGKGPFLRTGDLGYLRNGELFITGRLKDLIIIRGSNHYPQDIELTVEDSHDALRPGSVAALSVDIEGEERLVVVQEVSPRKDLDLDAVIGAIRQAVAQMHELQVYTVVLIKPRTIPKTSSGKIQRRACQQAFIDGHLKVVKEWRATLPQGRRTEKTFLNDTLEDTRDASHESPNAALIETWLVSNLAKMLGINRSEIDRRQAFASLGLDSAQTVRLIGELEAWLGRSLSPTLAWEFPTIKALAQHLAGEATTPVYTIDTPRNLDSEPIAIIGLGCRFPGAEDPEAFWRLLRDGVDAITEVPTDRWDVNAFYDLNPVTPGKMNTRWSGFLEHIDLFDPHFFGISPREAASMDPQQRLVLEVSWEALENAGQAAERLAGSQAGVFIGISTADYSQRQYGDPAAFDAYAGTGNALSIAANRLSYLLDLRGPSLAVDTACSSSLVAVHYACQSLRNGECSLALAGGVNVILSPELTITFSQARMMASDGRCKTFDAEADGYVRSEGCGIVVLKRLSDALKEGDTILAVVRGSAVNQDGRSNGLTAPSGSAQQAVIHRALENARVSPDQVCYVETHGTGTPLGDPIEFRALAAVLGEGRAPDQPCVLGSVKTNIGHLEAAAGIAGLIKAVLLLQNEEIPRHLHLKKINPHLPLENTPFVIATERRSLLRGTKPRLVGVSSFGFGGTNAHVVLEEAPISEPAQVEVERPLHLLALSGKTEEALKQVAMRYADSLVANPNVALADFCFSANTGRSHFNYRLSVVAGSVTQAREKLRTFIAGQEPTGVFKGQVLSTHKPKLAFLFTGQGSQYIGMGRQLYETQPSFRQVLERCDEILRPYLERSLVELLYPKSGETSPLDETVYTQPALFALEYALAQLWRSWGIEPSVVMGHSVGEYVAACVAGVFSLEDGLKLIAERGRLMQNLPEEGEMLVLMAEEARVQVALRPYPGEVAIAAINGPQNVVISGRRAAVQAVAAMLEREGIKTRPLTVSHAFHSPLMEPMQAEFAQVARSIKYAAPKLLLVSNVTGRLATEEVANPGYWVRHVRAAVRFADGVAMLREQGAGIFMEIGPKPTLLGMAQPCLGPAISDQATEDRPVMLPSLRPGRSDWQQILESLSMLYVHGVKVDWAGYDKAYTRRKVVLPTYPFQRQRCWVEASKRTPGGGFAKREVAPAAAQDTAVGREWLYAVDWQPQPQFGLPPDYLPTIAQLHQEVHAELAAQLPQTTALDRYVAAVARLNTLSIDYVVAALIESGLSFEPGARWQSRQIAEQIGVIAPYRRLLERLLAMLAEAGILQPGGDVWTVVRAPPHRDLPPLSEPYQTVARAELSLLKRCGAHLGQVLRGVQEPLELLFPGGDASTVSQLYQDSPTAQIMNHLVQEAVQTAIAQLPAGRGLRLLEVGAGTGGTTVGLLPLLPARQTEYLFTDIGAAFLPKAQAKFAAYDFVAYQTLDIEQPPAGQGFALHQYDIVVSANVLHATRDLSATLTHVRQLLAPGGLLVLLEATTRHRWLDLTFGLTDGWWRFADRRIGHPLLSADQWRECLLGNGFQSVTHVPEDPAAAPLDQALIIAEAPATYLAQERPWLLFTDATGLGAALAEQLRRRGERTILVSAGTAYAHVDDHSFRIHPDHAADYAQLATAAGAVRGVVHLWSLDEALARPAEGARPGAELEVAAWRGCGTVLHLVQALLRTQAQPPGVWLVTQGTQAVRPAETVPGVSQSPLWGMGKVIALEHPELQCVRLDLDGHADAAAQAAVLCAELTARAPFAPREDQVAWRNGLRYAARLVRPQGQAAGPVIIREDVTYLITGGLGGLGLLVARWLAEQGARYLLLLGRRQPTPEARRTLDELSARGTQVIVVQADVTDHAQVSGALAEIDPAHPLCGVIHAAGVLDDGALVQQTWERFAKVLAPKIEGAWNLHRLTQGMTLDLFVLFSSVAALLGNRGQANHAAANAFLDAFAHYRNAQHLPALSINWGQWAGTGKAAGLDDRYHARLVAQGVNPIAPERGLQVLGQLLGQTHAQIGVLPINWSAFREQSPAGMPLPLLSELAPKARSEEEVKQVSEQQHKLLQRLKRATASDRQELLVSYVQERVTEILGLDSSFRPAPRQPLNELGVDSLMIAQLKNRFMSELEVDVPIKEFIGGVSIAQLVGLLLDRLALSSVALSEAPPSDISEDMEEIAL